VEAEYNERLNKLWKKGQKKYKKKEDNAKENEGT
jgi:hypothetical protein